MITIITGAGISLPYANALCQQGLVNLVLDQHAGLHEHLTSVSLDKVWRRVRREGVRVSVLLFFLSVCRFFPSWRTHALHLRGTPYIM